MSPYTFENLFNYYTFSFRSTLEVYKVNHVFRDKTRCIFWQRIAYRLNVALWEDFRQADFQEGKSRGFTLKAN